jgi:prepilin-type N-terminal cleavage/methylation domain-containing protein
MTGLRRGDRGFTLIEVMVATSVLGIVMLIIYSALSSGIKQASDVEARIQIEADVRAMADPFVRDLRQAYTGDATLNRIGSMAAAQITFYSPDRVTPFHLRQISYRMTGTTLERSVTTSTNTNGAPWTFGTTGAYVAMLKDVRNPTLFTYRDTAGAATTDRTQVATIELNVTVDRDPTRSPAELSYSTTTELRGE